MGLNSIFVYDCRWIVHTLHPLACRNTPPSASLRAASGSKTLTPSPRSSSASDTHASPLITDNITVICYKHPLLQRKTAVHRTPGIPAPLSLCRIPEPRKTPRHRRKTHRKRIRKLRMILPPQINQTHHPLLRNLLLRISPRKQLHKNRQRIPRPRPRRTYPPASPELKEQSSSVARKTGLTTNEWIKRTLEKALSPGFTDELITDEQLNTCTPGTNRNSSSREKQTNPKNPPGKKTTRIETRVPPGYKESTQKVQRGHKHPEREVCTRIPGKHPQFPETETGYRLTKKKHLTLLLLFYYFLSARKILKKSM